jgi:hypothetical protein
VSDVYAGNSVHLLLFLVVGVGLRVELAQHRADGAVRVEHDAVEFTQVGVTAVSGVLIGHWFA